MKTISIEIYEEEMNFTATEWTEEEEWYIGNSDFAYIFYGTEEQKQAVMQHLEEIEDAMFLADDNGTSVFFTNEELSVEQREDIEFELGIDTYSFFTGVSGTYTEFDFDAE